MSDFKGPKFKKLQKLWYDKLKKQGFRDIENSREELTDHQSVYDFSQRIGFRVALFEAIQGYYYWASDMLILGKFESALDRRIWALHATGRSTRYIAGNIASPWAKSSQQTMICRKIKKIRKYLQMQEIKSEDGLTAKASKSKPAKKK